MSESSWDKAYELDYAKRTFDGLPIFEIINIKRRIYRMNGKYCVATCTDGNYLIRSEHSSKEQAFKAFHSLCAALWNDDSFTTAMVKVLDENLDCVEGKMELILKTPNEVEEEQEEQPAEE